MLTTRDLIASLASDLAPVRRLRSPLVRATAWLAFAITVVGLLAVSHGVRPDLMRGLLQPAFVMGLTGSLLTGVLAVIAAFMTSLPDRSQLWGLLPTPALILWISTVGYGCLTAWVDVGADGIEMGETARCFATLVLTSLPLSLAMLVMLRHAALMRPTVVALSGSLAVASISATSLSILHSLDVTIMVLIWNIAVAILIVALGGVFGRRLLAWVAPRPLLHC